MAKKSVIAKNQRRREMVERYARRRKELKVASTDERLPREEREAAMVALHRLPRDASPTRVRHRDALDGRPRGYIRRVGLSRLRFRELALRGELPGVRRASW